MDQAPNPLYQALLTIREMRTRIEAMEQARQEPVAIIGMACRLPGGANSPQAYWQMLCEGREGVAETPPGRWNLEALYDPNPDAPGKIASRRGGFLDEVAGFDAAFFGISPAEAVEMDPQQRLMLELTWEALEDAGLDPGGLAGSKTGVFVGIATSDYFRLTSADPARIGVFTGTGGAESIATGRLSYVFDWQGPNMAVDTACSSSLVALHLACQSLRSGESTLAVAGGVNLLVATEPNMVFSRMRMLAPDGRCKSFDAAADGYVRGEGCGMLVLKRLSAARRDGDRVLAVVRGSAVNQDGKSAGITAPNMLSQQQLMRDALASARVDAGQVGYVEAHGTGTALGDPIELEALKAVYGAVRPDGLPCWVGAVKSNIGHLEAAAGVAGLIKAVQVLRHGELPANLHFQTLNPRISLAGSSLAVPTRRVALGEAAGSRFAAVSSFGFSGTNAHVVLEAAPEPTVPAAAAGAPAGEPSLLLVSARSEAALRALAARYRELLAVDADVAGLCAAAARRRSHHAHRLAVVGAGAAGLQAALDAHANGVTGPAVASGHVRPAARPKVAFVCGGQGTQWAGMARGCLGAEPAFRDEVEAIDRLFERLSGWSIAELLASEAAELRLGETAVAQAALFAVQMGQAALWRSWGLVPDAVVGHSVGEVAAACLAGVLDREGAVRVVFERGRLMQEAGGRGGSMAAVELDEAAALRALEPYAGRVWLAAVNGPGSVTLSGDAEPLDLLLSGLKAEGVTVRALAVDYAFHSHHLDPFVERLAAALADLQASAPAGGPLLFSTLSGAPALAGDYGAGYWSRQMREPVRFHEAIRDVSGAGVTVFVELGAHPALGGYVRQTLAESGSEGLVLSSMRRGSNEREALLRAVAALHARGRALDWAALFPHAPHAELPAYPWQHQPFWVEADRRPVPLAPTERDVAHPLLGTEHRLASASGACQWETLLDPVALAAWHDHRFAGISVMPGGAYLERALAAGRALLGEGALRIEALAYPRPLRLATALGRRLQVAIARAGSGADFQVASLASASNERWLHATGRVTVGNPAPAPPFKGTVDEWLARCDEPLDAGEAAALLSARGLDNGPAFRSVRRLWRSPGLAVGELTFSPAGPVTPWAGVMDGCIQVAMAALDTEDPRVLAGFETGDFHALPDGGLWCQALARPATSGSDRLVDLVLWDASDRALWTIRGLRLAAVDRGLADEFARGEAPAPSLASVEAPVGAAWANPAERVAHIASAIESLAIGLLGLDATRLDPHEPLPALGLNSLLAVELKNGLERRYGLPISALVLIEHPTIAGAAAAIAGLFDAAGAPAPFEAVVPRASNGAGATRRPPRRSVGYQFQVPPAPVRG